MKKDDTKTVFYNIQPILKEIPFFEDFSDGELDFFSKNVSLRYFPEKTVLFREGETGDYLFFVVEGIVDVRLQATDTKPLIIATFERGSCVGEMSIVDDYPRSATIVVSESSELLILTRNRFDDICREKPYIGMKFLRGLAKNLSIRLRKTTGRFADLA